MSNIATLPTDSTYNPKMLALIKRTVAADTNDDEFSLFIHTARHLGLDPLRKQVYAFVFGKKAKDQSKRRMSIITAIEGFRSVADGTGNYRPDEDEPIWETDPALVSPHNPAGLIKAVVRAYKHSHGAWHRITGVAFWTEFAPLKEEWSSCVSVDTGEKWPDGNTKYRKEAAEGATKIITLDDGGNWPKMSRHMLAKVAEAQALRKGWPDKFSNVYAPEEISRAQLADLTPAEAATVGATEERLERIGHKDTILMGWADAKLIPVPVGQIADRAMAFIRDHREEPSAIMLWQEQNRHGLKEFWARSPNDALAVKKEIEAALAVSA